MLSEIKEKFNVHAKGNSISWKYVRPTISIMTQPEMLLDLIYQISKSPAGGKKEVKIKPNNLVDKKRHRVINTIII